MVMVEHELASVAQNYLSHPIWARRISVLVGSPLRISDLGRARASRALACFIHTDRMGDPELAVSTNLKINCCFSLVMHKYV